MLEKDEMTRLMQEIGQREKQDKLERYRRLNKLVKPGQILFAGSSLMEQFPINELLLDLGIPMTVYNRGVGGFTTQEMAAALDVCVYQLKPRHIFLNIGTNDLNGPDYTLSGLIERYEGILREIKAHLPKAGLTLLAYYPVNAQVGMKNPWGAEVFQYRTNARIEEANGAVQKLAERQGLEFLNCNAPITDEGGSLKAEYTVEGMHIYGDGYMQVLKKLLPALKALEP